MDINKQLINKLIIAGFILFAVFSWFLLSLYIEYICFKDNGWFARSGAILVFGSIWSALLTRPAVEDAEVPDLAKIYEHEKCGEPLKKKHWTVKYNLSKKLIVLELFLGSLGTLVWAYGDLWLPKCCT